MSNKLPKFIIAGAPKCGTSSLFEWLNEHPHVCGSCPKETFYFIDIDDPLIKPKNNYNLHGLENYLLFYKHCNLGTDFTFEASTHYMYQKTAREFFGKLIPQPKIIFVLRKPSDLIFSTFNFAQNNFAVLSKDVSFHEYVDLLLSNNLDKIKGKFKSARVFNSHKTLLQQGEYYTWIKQWSLDFQSTNIRIILFENMINMPRETLKDLAEYIGIDPTFYDNFKFEIKNKTVPIRNIVIHRIAVNLAPFISSKIKFSLKSLYFSMQGRNNNLKSADSETILRLDNYFSAYNENLSKEFSLNLDCWE